MKSAPFQPPDADSYSDLTVLKSRAGYYVGTILNDTGGSPAGYIHCAESDGACLVHDQCADRWSVVDRDGMTVVPAGPDGPMSMYEASRLYCEDRRLSLPSQRGSRHSDYFDDEQSAREALQQITYGVRAPRLHP